MDFGEELVGTSTMDKFMLYHVRDEGYHRIRGKIHSQRQLKQPRVDSSRVKQRIVCLGYVDHQLTAFTSMITRKSIRRTCVTTNQTFEASVVQQHSIAS